MFTTILTLIISWSIISFIASLILYCQAKSANKKAPGTYNEMQLKTRKNALIASSLVAGIILSVILGFVILLMTAVAHM